MRHTAVGRPPRRAWQRWMRTRGARRRWTRVRRALAAGARSDTGSAVAEFALVGALLSLVFASVLQIGLAMHVRNTVIDSALAGARVAALADRTDADGVAHTAELISAAIGTGYAGDIRVDHDAGTVTITARVPVPVLGLAGPRTWELRGTALRESTSPANSRAGDPDVP